MLENTTLAIETSQQKGSIALKRTNGELFYAKLRDDKRHDNDLMPAISRLFAEAKLKPESLDIACLSAGPGSFTGLRIAVSTVKMLAYTLKCKVIAVPSALVATETIVTSKQIIVALASKRDAFWSTRLSRDDTGNWQIDGTPHSTAGDDLDLSEVNLIVADKFLPESFRSRIKDKDIEIVAPVFDAGMCLNVAIRQFAKKRQVSDPDTLLPIYAREPEAVSIWQARKAKSV